MDMKTGWLKTGLIGLVVGLLAIQEVEASIGKKAPEITSPIWINSEPQSLIDLRGKVVLVEFWTFGCFNCQNVEPQMKKWHQDYAKDGLVVIGVHSPEFSHEKDAMTVKKYVVDHRISYAVAIDNDFHVWNRYKNRYWPAIYLVDKQGIIRYTRVGEGGYRQTEETIQMLLAETPIIITSP
jgi:thiol-disulfide isomerase/thioredoxin